MSKAKVSWAFQERPVASSKMNQAIIDYITPALPIWSFSYNMTVDDPGVPVTGLEFYGFYPYNPQKSVYDRLYLIGRVNNSGLERADQIEVTFDGGSSWTPAFPSATAAPVMLGGGAGDTLVEIWNLDVQVATFQWIGTRLTDPIGQGNVGLARLIGFLYRSTDTPF
jgi:hypothetical protein